MLFIGGTIRSENERIKHELWQCRNRERLQREIIKELQDQLENNWRNYPITSHPRVRLLMESLATVLGVLQEYEIKKDTSFAPQALLKINVELDRLLKNNQNIKKQEKEFVSDLNNGGSRDSILSDLEDGMQRQRECINKINEIAERLKRHLSDRNRSYSE
jgi:hypothetical protein